MRGGGSFLRAIAWGTVTGGWCKIPVRGLIFLFFAVAGKQPAGTEGGARRGQGRGPDWRGLAWEQRFTATGPAPAHTEAGSAPIRRHRARRPISTEAAGARRPSKSFYFHRFGRGVRRQIRKKQTNVASFCFFFGREQTFLKPRMRKMNRARRAGGIERGPSTDW